MEHHTHEHHYDGEVSRLLFLILQEIRHMAGELDALKAAVAHNTDVEESAITLLQGLKAVLDAAIASGDPAVLSALSASISAETDKLAAAVAANTPAA
jgi:hypothetical protein